MACLGILGFCFGTIIYIESLNRRGYWLDAHDADPKTVRFTSAAQWYVVTMPDSAESWAKWILRDGGDGYVLLESVRYVDHYMDAHHSYSVQLTHSNYPRGESWAQWRLTEEGNNYYFESAKYRGRYLESSYDSRWGYYGNLPVGKTAGSRMRVYHPQINDSWQPTDFDVDNRLGQTPYIEILRETVGISVMRSDSVSVTVGVSIGAEIKKILTVGASLSVTWEHSSSTTWSSQTTRERQITVAPGTRKQIFQAVAEYGVDDVERGPYYTVRSNRLRIVDTSVNRRNTTSDNIDIYPIIRTAGINGAHTFYFHGLSLFCVVMVVLLSFCTS